MKFDKLWQFEKAHLLLMCTIIYKINIFGYLQ